MADNDKIVRDSVTGALKKAGYAVTAAEDSREALYKLRQKKFDLAFLDVWSHPDSLDLIAKLRDGRLRAKLIIMIPDKAPEGLLRAIREQAYEYLCKPFRAEEAVEIADRASGKDAAPPIEVISARPHWVELLAPCTIEAAEEVRSFVMSLECDIPNETRRNVGMALRELLLNAVEWGGQLDPNRKVRIAQIRSSRMLLYRIVDPGPGFRFENLKHAVDGKPAELFANVAIFREERGMRPGGFGIAMTRAIADELLYNEAQNEVILIKYIAALAAANGTDPCAPNV